MVFQWVNFVQETNNWWLRRIRPLWVTGALAYLGFFSYRYYFFGKWSVYKDNQYTEEQRQDHALQNKRDWGYNSYYKPELARSRKRIIQETLGDQYRHAEKFENMYTYDTRTVGEILEEENNWE